MGLDMNFGKSWLAERFREVRFVQIYFKGTRNYNARLDEFRKLLIKITDSQLQVQKMLLGFDVSKSAWCGAAEQVMELIGNGKPQVDSGLGVNMIDVYSQLMANNTKFFFKDALDVFHFRNHVAYGTLDALKAGRGEAQEVAIDYAARILACEKKELQEREIDDCKWWVEPCESFMTALFNGMPCCSQRGDGKTQFCGQMRLGHGKEHKSLNKKEMLRRKMIFWSETYCENEVWGGEFQNSEAKPEPDVIWKRAEEYMTLGPTAMGEKALDRLPKSYCDLLGVDSAETDGNCFLCLTSLASIRRPSERSSQNNKRMIRVCVDCNCKRNIQYQQTFPLVASSVSSHWLVSFSAGH